MFFDILEGFDGDEGGTVLLVKEASADEETAVSVEEMFDTFGAVYVFVLPEDAEVERTTKARIAMRAGINFGALSRARREYRMLLANPGHGHLHSLGEALDAVWD